MIAGPVVVLGAGGMLGKDVVSLLRERGEEVRALARTDCDVTCREQLRQAVAGAGTVVNCAAFTDVDGAEAARAEAVAVNTTAPGRLAVLCEESGALLVHVSTDFVFDGTRSGAYSEADAPAPLSVYGATKLAGERQIQATECRHCILRVQWTYGRHGTHFVGAIARLAAARRELRVVSDQRGTPTATIAIAEVVRRIAAGGLEGLFHFAPAGATTRFELARAIVARLGLPATVVPCTAAEYGSAAARPANSVFDCSRIDAALDLRRPPWEEELNRFLDAAE